jgi:hypothetical protein
MKIIVAQVPPYFTYNGPTGFGSLPENQLYYPEMIQDEYLVRIIQTRMELIDEFNLQSFLGSELSEKIAQSFENNNKEFFEKVISRKFPMANTKDVDFLKVIDIPDGMNFKVVQGKSGYEEVIVWNDNTEPYILV